VYAEAWANAGFGASLLVEDVIGGLRGLAHVSDYKSARQLLSSLSLVSREPCGARCEELAVSRSSASAACSASFEPCELVLMDEIKSL
jgi:hypothetical protein